MGFQFQKSQFEFQTFLFLSYDASPKEDNEYSLYPEVAKYIIWSCRPHGESVSYDY